MPGKCNLGQGDDANQTCFESFGNAEMSEYFDLKYDKSTGFYAQVLGNTLTKNKNTRLVCEQGFRN